MRNKSHTRWVAPFLVFALVGAQAARGHADPPPNRAVVTWRRPVGPVQLAVTAVLVAPGKSSGQPWDGIRPLPTETQQGLVQGLAPQAVQAVCRAFIEGAGAGAVSRMAPWASNAFLGSFSAPDVRVDVLLNGTTVSRVRTQTHTFTPSWPLSPSTSVEVGANQQIDVDAWDVDLVRDDRIGVCTIQGMPMVDRNGYARAQDFTCNGQLWGVRLRVVAESYVPVAASDVQEGPPPSAAPVAPPTPPTPSTPPTAPSTTPPSAPAEARRGGAGESCTRTDDCNTPLRCIRHECTVPSE